MKMQKERHRLYTILITKIGMENFVYRECPMSGYKIYTTFRRLLLSPSSEGDSAKCERVLMKIPNETMTLALQATQIGTVACLFVYMERRNFK
jgi:hypothetical protein